MASARHGSFNAEFAGDDAFLGGQGQPLNPTAGPAPRAAERACRCRAIYARRSPGQASAQFLNRGPLRTAEGERKLNYNEGNG